MSLILEALKKSEAERRLGRAPGLLSPAPPVRRRHGLWPLLLVLVLAVVLSTGITWWLLRPSPATSAGPGAREAPAEQVAAGNSTANPAPARAPLEPAPAPAGPPVLQPPAASVPAPAATTASVRPAVEREYAPMPADAALLQAPRSAPARARPDTELPQAATPAPAAEPGPSAPAPAPAVAHAPPQPAQATEPERPVEPDEPAVPALRTLPADLQAALPPLKLSMHVFNEDPAQRFVLIDGRRYSEGMALAEGLVLEAIRRDGVVLVFRGHRFHLPRPG